MSTAEVAQYIGVVSKTVYRLANTGQLVGYKHGRVLRFLLDDVDTYLAGARLRPGDLDHLVPPSD
jgi:excisionase family DNA binding protein